MLKEFQSVAFPEAVSLIETVNIEDVLISSPSRDVFSYNLKSHFYPLDTLMACMVSVSYSLREEVKLVVISNTVSIMMAVLSKVHAFYVRLLDEDCAKQEYGARMTASERESIQNVYQDGTCIKSRLILQFITAYISALYEYENASLSLGLCVYSMNPVVDYVTFFETSIRKLFVLNRIAVPGKDVNVLYTRFSRVHSLARHWIQVFAFVEVKQDPNLVKFMT